MSGFNPKNTSNMLIGFSPNDFFYTQAQQENIMSTDPAFCPALDIYNASWDVSCNNINFIDNSQNCIGKELCRNLDKASTIYNIRAKHTEADERYSDTSNQYKAAFLNTVNLSIGLIFLLGFILKNRGV